MRPAHYRLLMAWAASKWPELLTAGQWKSIAASVLERQHQDGGWTLEALGPWKPHPNAPPAIGPNAYAIAWAAFTLDQAGAPKSDARMRRALGWLRRRQDPKTGAWAADSMNKRYEPGSMQAHFMRDAATAFVSLALLAAQ